MVKAFTAFAVLTLALLGGPAEASPRKKKKRAPAKPELTPQERNEIRRLMGRVGGARHEAKREEAVMELAKKGEKADMAIPVLRNALKDKAQNVRLAGAYALGQVGKRSKDAVKALTKIVAKNKDTDLRKAAASGLGEIGPFAKGAVKPLKKALGDENAELRVAAATALGRIGDASASPDLADTLKDEDGKVRTASAIALTCLGATPDAAIPVLAATVQDKSQLLEVRCDVARALSGLGSKAEPAVPALIKAAKERFRHDPKMPYQAEREKQVNELRVLAINALGAIGSKAAAAVAALETIAEDGGAAAEAAEQALEKIRT